MNRLLQLFYTLGDTTTRNSGLAWPHLLLCMALLLAVVRSTAEVLIIDDQRNAYTLEKILATQYTKLQCSHSQYSIKSSHSQYSIKSKETRYLNKSNLRKEIEIEIKSKETSYVAIMHQSVTVNSNMQPNTCTNKGFSTTSTRFNPCFG